MPFVSATILPRRSDPARQTELCRTPLRCHAVSQRRLQPRPRGSLNWIKRIPLIFLVRYCSIRWLTFLAATSIGRAALAPGYVEVDAIHADIALPYIGDATSGVWQPFVFAGVIHYEGIYAANKALLIVKEGTLTARPAGSQFDFMGVPEGTPIYRLSASQVPDQLYLGVEADYGTTSPERMLLNKDTNYKRWDPDDAGPTDPQRWVEIAVKAVRGPGHVSVYNFPGFSPRAWVASADGITADDEWHQIPRSHSHYNWAFTQPGYYEIDIQARTFLGPNSGAGTEVVSPIVTFHFQVGPAPETTLRIFRDGTDAVLAWPNPSPGFQLQSSPSLSPPAWTDVLTAPAIVGREKQVIWGPASGSRFFRLFRP